MAVDPVRLHAKLLAERAAVEDLPTWMNRGACVRETYTDLLDQLGDIYGLPTFAPYQLVRTLCDFVR